MSNDERRAFLDVLDATSNKELRDLAERWNDKAEHTAVFKPPTARGVELAYKQAAKELKRTIDDE